MNPRYSRYYTFITPVLKNKFVRSWAWIGFSIATIFVLLVFAVRPTVSTIIGLQKSISEQNAIVQKLIKKSDDLATSKKAYEQIDPNIKSKIATLIPDKTDINILTDTLTSLAKQANASMSALQFQTIDITGKPNNYSLDYKLEEIPFTLSLSGKYPDLVRFLDSLTNSARLINLQNVNIGLKNDNSVSMSINAKAYYVKQTK